MQDPGQSTPEEAAPAPSGYVPARPEARSAPGMLLAGAVELTREGIRQLSPAYFSLVMATGIVSIASGMLGMSWVAWLLFELNLVAYPVLWLLTLARLARFPREVVADLLDHGRGPGFFTVVAGTAVLGSQFVLVGGSPRVAVGLWIVSLILWMGLTYAIFTGLTIKQRKPSLAEGINGGWLLAIVATQSVGLLGGLVTGELRGYREIVLFFSLAIWLFGGMLYVWIISLIVYRYLFFPFSPRDLTPPYWINMGAVAISSLAGAVLIQRAPDMALLESTLPFLKGVTLLFWATGTWWIPMLVILGVWRHVYRRFPLSYDPLYWGAVFPLGMYAACTYRLAELTGVPYLTGLARTFIYIALAAWLSTFLGLVGSLIRSLRSALP